MRKLVLILLLVVCALSAKSQARIGYTYNEIKKEFSSKGIEDIKTDDGSKLLAFKMNADVSVFYYFKRNNCVLTIIYTAKESVADDIIRAYDAAYVQVNTTMWKTENERVGTIFVIFNYNIKEDYYTFTWK